MTIRFAEDEVRPMGRAAAGVRGMKLKADDEVVSCDVARDDATILIVTDAGYGKRTQLDKFNRQGRGGQGVKGIKLTARKGVVVAAFMVGLDDEIFVIASSGTAHPHVGARDLLAGPRRHRRPGHEPRRRRDRGLGGARCCRPRSRPAPRPSAHRLTGRRPPTFPDRSPASVGRWRQALDGVREWRGPTIGGQVLPLMVLVVLVAMGAAAGCWATWASRWSTGPGPGPPPMPPRWPGWTAGARRAEPVARANGGRVRALRDHRRAPPRWRCRWARLGGHGPGPRRWAGDAPAAGAVGPATTGAGESQVDQAGPAGYGPCAPSGAIAQSVRAHP